MRLTACLSLMLLATVAHADDEAVGYGGIDASTLRVFAVGTVGVKTVQHEGSNVEIAEPQSGHGTGFAVEPELILTAHHVIDGARHVVIRLPGKRGFLPARVVYANKADDIAVLHASAELAPIRMHKDGQLRVRQNVFAVGYPVDASRTQAQSARGIIAGHLDDGSLQLDISLNPGNSGGPLVDESDKVVGMVIARGNVEKGVHGIGVAVPVAKLRAAIAEARRVLDAGTVKPISEHERMSAEVVDELVRQGTLRSVREGGGADDLKRTFERRDLEQEIDRLAARLNDADLLLFVAGSMWNASLALHHGGVRTIGDRNLSEPEAQALAHGLHVAAVRLVRRGREIDTAIGERSSFVATALRADVGERSSFVATAAPARGSRWTLQATSHLRSNTEASGGWGGGVELKNQRMNRDRSGVRGFFSWGFSAGRAYLESPDAMSLTHSFYALEMGGGISIAIGASTHFELYAGTAPSYYTASHEGLMGTATSESGIVLDHFRATASVAFNRWYLSSGLRLISSTVWIEPIGLGINF
ncbi:MAG: trypsin-like peptidase domain-containing protein [Deltaproteobacteria bacterium]|nr:trypsin-like peptidase domain-containing protein [Deltaproteobacteria bacterium]